MKKCFSIAMLIVGSMVGAGFASGRELVVFFGEEISPIAAVFCAAVIFLLCVVFLTVGAKIEGQNISVINKSIAKKTHLVWDIFILTNCFIVAGGMLAASDSLGAVFFDIKPLYSLLIGSLCVVVAVKGTKGIIAVSRVLVPVLIIALIAVSVVSTPSESTINASFGIGDAGFSLLYVCMNIMLAVPVITTVGKLDKKTILVSSAIGASVIGALIFVLGRALSGSGLSGADMPVLMMAKQISPIIFGLIAGVIAIAIFTSAAGALCALTSWFNQFFNSRILSAIIVFLGAATLAQIGYGSIIAFLYPVIGAVGLVYALLGTLFALDLSPLSKACNQLFKQSN